MIFRYRQLVKTITFFLTLAAFMQLHHNLLFHHREEAEYSAFPGYESKFDLVPGILVPESAFENNSIKWCHNRLKYIYPKGPRTALASYPGSGNTWVRYLLQQATGIVTGSVYNNKDLKLSYFPAEGLYDGSVLAVKTHVGRPNPPNPDWPVKFDRAVVIVRDPFDTLLAEFNRIHSHSQLGFAPKVMFSTEDWHNHVNKNIDFWKGFHLWFLLNYEKHEVYFTRFELLRDNIEVELQNILHFLGYSMSTDILQCVVENKEGNYHRKRSLEQDYLQDVFTDDMTNKINRIRAEIYERVGLKNALQTEEF